MKFRVRRIRMRSASLSSRLSPSIVSDTTDSNKFESLEWTCSTEMRDLLDVTCKRDVTGMRTAIFRLHKAFPALKWDALERFLRSMKIKCNESVTARIMQQFPDADFFARRDLMDGYVPIPLYLYAVPVTSNTGERFYKLGFSARLFPDPQVVTASNASFDAAENMVNLSKRHCKIVYRLPKDSLVNM